MRQVSTSIDISASAECVWRVLTDFAEYRHWNPFIRRIDGYLSPGAGLVFTIVPAPDRTTTARARVLEIEENRRLVWGGSLPLGLFSGTHSFVIKPAAAGTVLENMERFSGPLAALVMRSRRLELQRQAFQAFNLALKRRAEAVATESNVAATETS